MRFKAAHRKLSDGLNVSTFHMNPACLVGRALGSALLSTRILCFKYSVENVTCSSGAVRKASLRVSDEVLDCVSWSLTCGSTRRFPHTRPHACICTCTSLLVLPACISGSG